MLTRQERFALESALILENRLAGLSDLVTTIRPDVPVYVASSKIMDAVAGFPMHRGVLAVGMRPAACDQPPPPRPSANWRTIIALSGLANHDNVGAIFRNAVGLGADAVVMDAATCDPLYRKALRVSVGGVLTLPWHKFETAASMLDWMNGAGFETAALSPSGAVSLENWHPEEKTALLLGTEGPGLATALMERLTTVRIPMARDFDSLNVATCAALVLNHVRMRR